jgi:hypothetical protein
MRGESWLGPHGPPEHGQSLPEVKGYPLKRTEHGVEREERVGQINRAPDARAKDRSLDQIQAIAQRGVKAVFIKKPTRGCYPLS